MMNIFADRLGFAREQDLELEINYNQIRIRPRERWLEDVAEASLTYDITSKLKADGLFIRIWLKQQQAGRQLRRLLY